MCRNRYIISFVLFLAAFSFQYASGQEIKGDTIYTSVVVPTILHFPENITSCVYNDPAANNRFHAIVITSAVAIRAKTDNAKPALLKVSEGNRNHVFVLVFKKKLAPDELAHQWSDTGSLRKYTASREARKSIAASTSVSQKNIINKTKISDSTSLDIIDPADNDYEAMFAQSNVLLEKKDYFESKKLFNKATALKEKKYKEQINAANQALLVKDFEEANAKSTLALEIKPDDLYAQKLVATSQMRMDSVLKMQKKDEVYDSVISKANAAIALLDYAKAQEYFKEAQSLKPAESVPVNMLKYIESAVKNLTERQKYSDSVQRVVKTRETLEKANTEVLAKNWRSAMDLYKQVLVLDPTPEQEDFAKKKIETINLEFERIARQSKGTVETARVSPQEVSNEKKTEEKLPEANNVTVVRFPVIQQKAVSPKSVKTPKEEEEEKRREQERIFQRKLRINEWMDMAQQAFLMKNLDSAKAYYQHAIALYPSRERELFAKKRIEEIDLEIAGVASQPIIAKEATINPPNSSSEIAAKPIIVSSANPANTRNSIDLTPTVKKEESERLREQEKTLKQKLLVSEWMSKAHLAFLAKNYDSAKVFYTKVIAFHLSTDQEEFAVRRIDSIDFEIKKKTTVTKEPTAITPLQNKPESSAKTATTPAVANSTKTIQDHIDSGSIKIVSADDAEKRAEQERILNHKLRISEWMDKGQKAFLAQNWDSARAYYTEALALRPPRDREAFVKQRIGAIELELEREQQSVNTAESASILPAINTSDSTAQKKSEESVTKPVTTTVETPLKPIKILEKDTIKAVVKNANQSSTSLKIEDSVKSSTSVVTVANKPKSQDTAANESLVTAPSNNNSKIPSKNIAASSATDLNKDVQNQTNNSSVKTADNEEEKKRREQERVLQHKLKISEWMDKGQEAFLARNWDSAKTYYKRAIALLPSRDREAFARQRIGAIEMEMERERQPVNVEQPSTSAATSNTETIAQKNSEVSNAQLRTSITETSTKPIKTSPDTVIIAAKVIKSDSIEMAKNEELIKRKAKIENILSTAQKAMLLKNWDSAKANYRAVLTLQPSSFQEEFVKNKLNAIEQEIKKNSLQSTIVKETVVTAPNNTAAVQKETELGKAKQVDSLAKAEAPATPGITTNHKVLHPANNKNSSKAITGTAISSGKEPKVNQISTPAPDKNVAENKNEYSEASELMLRLTPRLALADSNNSIKMICQDISFSGKNAYIKLLIQNRSNDLDFSSDSLHILYIKNYGILKKLKPLYLSAVPNVMPGKESQIVYVTEAYSDVEPNEIFILEVEDKLKRSKLTIHVRGDVYNNLRSEKTISGN